MIRPRLRTGRWIAIDVGSMPNVSLSLSFSHTVKQIVWAIGRHHKKSKVTEEARSTLASLTLLVPTLIVVMALMHVLSTAVEV